MYYLISFAIGGLLGDVFFHTIPHMSSGHSHDHSQDNSSEHAHSIEDMANNALIIGGIVVFFLIEKITTAFFGDKHTHDSHGKKGEEDHEKELRYKSFAVLSLIGDLTHNFTDGLSIGVAYVASNLI
jgi:zinc transporter ZupT